MTPPASVEPVVCFATRWSDGRTLHAFVIEPGDPKAYEEYRALPVAAYNALLARLNTATVAADLMRARAEKAEREREEAVALLEYAKKYVKRAPHDLLMRLDAALAQRGGG